MLALPDTGSRTWMWTTLAPAFAASTADVAIASGVTGTAALRLGVSAEPVTAQETMVFDGTGCSVAGAQVYRISGRPSSSQGVEFGASLKHAPLAAATRSPPRAGS